MSKKTDWNHCLHEVALCFGMDTQAGHSKAKLICVTIARPGLEQIDNLVLPNLESIHGSVKGRCYFFSPGYSQAGSNESVLVRSTNSPNKSIAERFFIDDNNWYFNPERFMQTIKEIEKYSGWSYQQDSVILVMNVITTDRTSAATLVNDHSTLALSLHKILEYEPNFSISEFFKTLGEITWGFDGVDWTWGFPNSLTPIKQLVLFTRPNWQDIIDDLIVNKEGSKATKSITRAIKSFARFLGRWGRASSE